MMTINPLVSVIVPIYNVQQYLSRCVNSIMEQTYTNIEIILVDDGSNDKSPELCEEYKRKDKRIQVIHQQNRGLAAARNTGIEQSHGDYITFIDSDDYVTDYYVENLVSAINKDSNDLAISMFVNVIDGEENRQKDGSNILSEYKKINSEDCMADLLYQRGIETSAPGKLFKRSLIGELRFPAGKLYEDIMFTLIMIDRSASIGIIKNIDYLYYQRQGSIQYQSFNRRKMDCIWHSREMMNFVNNKYPQLSSAVIVRYFGGLCNIIFQIPDYGFEEEKSLILKDIKKYRLTVIKDSNARNKSKIAAVLSFLGLKLMKKIYMYTQTRGKVRSKR